MHHLMLEQPAPAQQEPAAPPEVPPAPALPLLEQQQWPAHVPQQGQQQQHQAQPGADEFEPGFFEQLLNGHFDGGLLQGPGAPEQHYSLLTVGGEQPAAGRGEFAGRSLVVQGSAWVTGELWTQGEMVVSGAPWCHVCRLCFHAQPAP